MDRILKVLIITVICTLPSCNQPEDYGVSQEKEWERIISEYQNDENVVYPRDLARLNMALAQTGSLAEDAFKYTQAGFSGLMPEWDLHEETALLLTDIYLAMGQVTMSMKMAFEANVCCDKEYSPEMMLRLIQTNIICGSYPIAEKYIEILDSDRRYRSQAEGFRRFLDNDKAVEQDPVLGPLRKCIPEKDVIWGQRGIDEDLKTVIRANPSYHKAMDYLGITYLLDVDMDGFMGMLDEFYGTEALPYLPEAFAEAACMISSMQPGYWKRFGVDTKVYRRYCDFKTKLDAGLSMDEFKGTWWYYVMRLNEQ